jgi:hypothetical protein
MILHSSSMLTTAGSTEFPGHWPLAMDNLLEVSGWKVVAAESNLMYAFADRAGFSCRIFSGQLFIIWTFC